jgi:hypothetical protein
MHNMRNPQFQRLIRTTKTPKIRRFVTRCLICNEVITDNMRYLNVSKGLNSYDKPLSVHDMCFEAYTKQQDEFRSQLI